MIYVKRNATVEADYAAVQTLCSTFKLLSEVFWVLVLRCFFDRDFNWLGFDVRFLGGTQSFETALLRLVASEIGKSVVRGWVFYDLLLVLFDKRYLFRKGFLRFIKIIGFQWNAGILTQVNWRFHFGIDRATNLANLDSLKVRDLVLLDWLSILYSKLRSVFC